MPGEICLSKTLEPEDYKPLGQWLPIVDLYKGADGQASEHRRWEYAMALEAVARWKASSPPTGTLMKNTAFDVGGAGSSLALMLASLGIVSEVIDPAYGVPLERLIEREEEEERVRGASKPGHGRASGVRIRGSMIFCISVLEHIPPAQLPRFVYCLGKIVAPGGLLFLTCDMAEDGTDDTQHFHWDRKQIFDWKKLNAVAQQLHRENYLEPFGGVDTVFHGAQVYPAYTFGSLCMVRNEAGR